MALRSSLVPDVVLTIALRKRGKTGNFPIFGQAFDVFRIVIVLPENPPSDTLYIEQGNNGRQKIPLGREEVES